MGLFKRRDADVKRIETKVIPGMVVEDDEEVVDEIIKEPIYSEPQVSKPSEEFDYDSAIQRLREEKEVRLKQRAVELEREKLKNPQPQVKLSQPNKSSQTNEPIQEIIRVPMSDHEILKELYVWAQQMDHWARIIQERLTEQ